MNIGPMAEYCPLFNSIRLCLADHRPDLPFVNEEAVSFLVSKRILRKHLFIESQHYFPEPFLTIQTINFAFLTTSSCKGQWSISQVLQHCKANPLISDDPRLLWAPTHRRMWSK
jgi:hypothetical protein